MKTSTDKRPTVVSLFAGCGGSSLGYKMAGFREVAAVEWWDEACRTLRVNFPGISILEGDVREKLEDARGLLCGKELDVLDGSPPCQGFSLGNCRKRSKGDIYDPRNDLVVEYIRWVRELQPRTFVMENVRGMVIGPMIARFNSFLREMQALNYQVQARLVSMAMLGVPQVRERVIIVGVRNDVGKKYEFPRPKINSVDYTKVLDALKQDKREADFLQLCENKAIREIWKGKFEPHNAYFSFCKMKPGKPIPTLTASGGQFGLASGAFHHAQPRRLTIPEAKVASTFPMDFKFEGEEDYFLRGKKDGAKIYGVIMRQLGNCVPPLGVQKIAEKLLEVLR